MSLAENIYKFRIEQNMSQLDLADALEVSRQSVSKWETGTAVPELDKLVKMCDLFDVSLDVLVGREAPAPKISEPQEKLKIHTQGVTSADLVSILILLFAVLIPIVILATSELHDSMFLMVLGLFIIPPLATICAALCSPGNTILFRAFIVYDILFGILAMIAGSVFAPFIAIVFLFVIGFWNDKREGH